MHSEKANRAKELLELQSELKSVLFHIDKGNKNLASKTMYSHQINMVKIDVELRYENEHRRQSYSTAKNENDEFSRIQDKIVRIFLIVCKRHLESELLKVENKLELL